MLHGLLFSYFSNFPAWITVIKSVVVWIFEKKKQPKTQTQTKVQWSSVEQRSEFSFIFK